MNINDVVRAYAGLGDTSKQIHAYKWLSDALDRKDEAVLEYLNSGDVYLFDGYEYRVSINGYNRLLELLQTRRI